MADDGQSIPLKPDTNARINCFVGKQISDTAYLMWKVQDIRNNGTFIIYRSEDGSHFSIIGTKKAIGTPIHNEIAYYIKDFYPYETKKYYRIVYLSNNSEYLVSHKLSMNEAKETFAGISKPAK